MPGPLAAQPPQSAAFQRAVVSAIPQPAPSAAPQPASSAAPAQPSSLEQQQQQQQGLQAMSIGHPRTDPGWFSEIWSSRGSADARQHANADIGELGAVINTPPTVAPWRGLGPAALNWLDRLTDEQLGQLTPPGTPNTEAREYWRANALSDWEGYAPSAFDPALLQAASADELRRLRITETRAHNEVYRRNPLASEFYVHVWTSLRRYERRALNQPGLRDEAYVTWLRATQHLQRESIRRACALEAIKFRRQQIETALDQKEPTWRLDRLPGIDAGVQTDPWPIDEKPGAGDTAAPSAHDMVTDEPEPEDAPQGPEAEHQAQQAETVGPAKEAAASEPTQQEAESDTGMGE